MNANWLVTGATAGTVSAILFSATTAAVAQASSGVTGYSPPPASRTERPPSGPGRSRLPLVDPKVVPPGGSDPTQQPPSGTPGAANETPGQSGQRSRVR
jgi:hypothetical protein